MESSKRELGSFPTPLMIALALAYASCGGSSSPAHRPVLIGPEDETSDDVSCTVVRRLELEERASVAPPAIAATATGAAVVWVSRHSGRRLVRFLEISSTLEPIGEILDIEPGGDMPFNLRLASCGQRYDVVWELDGVEDHSIRLATLPLGTLEHAEITPEIVTPNGVQPGLSCSDEITAIAWSRREGGIQDVFACWRRSDGSLSPPFRVSDETDAAATPAMACAEGRCAVVWSDRRAVYAEIYATLIDAGSEAGTSPVRVSEHDQTQSGAGGAYEPIVSPLESGSFLIAWRDNRSQDETEIYASTLSARGSVGLDRRISMSPAPSTMAATTSCQDGRAAVAWRDRRNGPTAIMIAAVDERARRRSAATRVSGNIDEASAPAAVCVHGSDHLLAWTQAAPEEGGGTLAMAVVRCQ